MRFRKSFRLALNILIHSKLRSWLTIIGIVIGVAAIVAIVSIGQGAQASVQSQLGGLGADIITISQGSGRAGGGGFGRLGGGTADTATSTKKNLTEKDLDAVKQIDGVLFADGIVSGRVTVSYLSESTTSSAQGVDPFAWQNMETSTLSAGRYLNPGDSNAVVVSNTFAMNTFKQPLAINRDITIEGKAFKIVGILAPSTGFGNGDSQITMPITAARDTIPDLDKTSLNTISVKVADVNNIVDTTSLIDARLLILRHVTNRTRDFSVTNSQATQQRLSGITQSLTLFLGAIAAVSLIVGAVGIANTMFTSVLEKTKEIGIMKAIGARNRDIMTIFLLNAALVGFVGGVLGIIFGAGISALLPSVAGGLGISLPGSRGGIVTALSPTLLISALLISVIIGVLAGVIPAYRASNLKPVDALRYQ